ncbi:MAG: ornithine cyclodeaminase family protein [Gemmatimonadales bacterium]
MPPTILLSAADVEAILDPNALIDSVEAAFRLMGRGDPQPGGVLGVEVANGGFHVKAAATAPDTGVFAAKLNGNFPSNPVRHGLPTIQGVVIVADVADGQPLALLESGSVTRLRTAAATAVAFRHLALPEADSLTLIGCGAQAFDQVRFAHAVRPLRQIRLSDRNPDAARALAARLAAAMPGDIAVADDLARACRQSPLIITCTTSREPFLDDDHIAPGAVVAAVGADNPHKQELFPRLLARSTVITDDTPQCAAIGELHHALAAGLMPAEAVAAELGQVVAGVVPGRQAASDRIVFDSTGLPIQDAAAATIAVSLARLRAGSETFSFRD